MANKPLKKVAPAKGKATPKTVKAKPVAKVTARKPVIATKPKVASKTAAAKQKVPGKPVKSAVSAKSKPVTAVAVKKKVAPAKTPLKPVKKALVRATTKAVALKKKIVKPAAKLVKTTTKAKPIASKLQKAAAKIVKSVKKATKSVKKATKSVKKATKSVKKASKAVAPVAAKVAKIASKPLQKIVIGKEKIKKNAGPKAASVPPISEKERGSKQMPLKQKTINRFKAPEAPVRLRVQEDVTQVPPQEKKAKLKAEDLKKLRNALLQERERILEELRTLDEQALTTRVEEGANQQPGFSLQLADSASENLSVETALILRSTEDEELSKIDDALRAIDSGDYGICHRCHEAITMDRLLVKPMTRYCVPCLRLLESGKA